MQLEDLLKCFDEDEIDVALKSIPRDIEDAYLRKLQRVAPKDAPRLANIFHWISVAARQLTTLELAAAPGVNLLNPVELLSICPSGMVRIEKQRPSDANEPDLQQQEVRKSSSTETDIITFDHPSVKRFLFSRALQQSSDDKLSRFFVSEKAINAKFAGPMVDYLFAIKQPKIGPSILTENPFLLYVAQHWCDHFKEYSNDPGEDEELRDKLLTLFGEPMDLAYFNWIRVWNPESKKQDFGLSQESCPSPLYVAIFLRFKGISKHLIDNCSFINGTGGLMCTALHLASQHGDTEMTQDLIAAGEDVDTTVGDQPTALYTAVENDNAQLVQMLLTVGANPNAEHAIFGPALQLASFRGFTIIVELLVASGADVNLQSIRFGTALQAAAAAGHSEIVAILLRKGSKPGVVGGLLGTAIQAASAGDHSKVVQMLAAEDIAWDEERDSIWHEAFDLWLSQSPRAKFEQHLLSESLFSTELPAGSNVQRMLAMVLKTFTLLPTMGKVKEDKYWKLAVPVISSQHTISQLAELSRRKGQEGMESGHYVYRALFWAMIYRCTTVGLSEIVEGLYKLSITISLRALDQKEIEHGTSDDLLAARHGLVECYTLAFQAVAVFGGVAARRPLRRFLSEAMEIVEGVEQQNERVENLMKVIRLQEPSTDVVLLRQMHSELLAKMQGEMRGSFLKLEEGMQKNLEEVEKRVVASVQDILPGIIREEMRKLLAEQKRSAGPDNRS